MMRRSPNQSASLEELILAFFDEDLDEAQQRHLADLLAESSDARALFDSYMRLEGIAVELGQASCLTTLPPDEPPADSSELQPASSSSSSRPRSAAARIWVTRMTIAAMAISLGVIIAMRSIQTPSNPPSVGHIARIVAADWVSAARPIGGDIVPGTYELRDGLVELEFDNGAIVILEGPAHFEVSSGERTFLRHGRMRTRVPPEAYGFMIDTPSMKVIDLGTEFGLEIDSSGAGEIHVFDGEVEVYNRPDHAAENRLLLMAGEALRVDATGHLNDIPADFDAFVDRLTLESRAAAYAEDMSHQLKEIDRRLAQLNVELKRAESTVRKSGPLRRLKRAANDAKQRWTRAQTEDPDLRKVVADREQARTKLNQLFREAIEGSDRGRELMSELKDANSQLSELKNELVAAKRHALQSAELRTIHRRLRQVQKDRKRIRSEVRSLRGQLGKNNIGIRAASEQLVQARKRANRQLSEPRFGKLRDEATKRHKTFLVQQRQRLLADQRVRDLKVSMREARQRQRTLKRDIQQARHATMTFTAFDGQNDSAAKIDALETGLDRTDQTGK